MIGCGQREPSSAASVSALTDKGERDSGSTGAVATEHIQIDVDWRVLRVKGVALRQSRGDREPERAAAADGSSGPSEARLAVAAALMFQLVTPFSTPSSHLWLSARCAMAAADRRPEAVRVGRGDPAGRPVPEAEGWIDECCHAIHPHTRSIHAPDAHADANEMDEQMTARIRRGGHVRPAGPVRRSRSARLQPHRPAMRIDSNAARGRLHSHQVQPLNRTVDKCSHWIR